MQEFAAARDNDAVTTRSLEQHRADVVALLSPLAPLRLSLADAVGCVVVADYAASPVPPLAIAATDGYAVRRVDTEGARMRPVTLPVTHDALPGDSPTRITPGSAVRVARGAALPFGADAVVSRSQGTSTTVLLDAEAKEGAGITAVGGEIAAGDIVVAAGTRLTAGHVAALAACGAASVVVRPAPRVVIIAVGSELRAHGASPERSAAREPVADATGPMLAVLFASAGAKVVRVTTVADDAPALRAALDDAALQADLVVTVGGLSTEWSDVVAPVLSHAFGVEVTTVRLGQGSRHGLGTIGHGDGRPVVLLALPGHPVDAAAAFASYVADAVAELRGATQVRFEAIAGEGWASPFGFAQVVAVARCEAPNGQRVAPVGDTSAPILRDLAAAEGLCVVPESKTEVQVGDAVEVMWWSR